MSITKIQDPLERKSCSFERIYFQEVETHQYIKKKKIR